MQKRYPFKFLDSYQRDDKEFFFGREEEIDALYQMIFQTKILVLYGTSGTGKTSLIQCGLANRFQTYDWLALYIRRGGNLISSLDKVLCNYSDEEFSYVESREEQLSIKNFLAKAEAVYKASFKPVYLIFDQFEELYILGSKKEQQAFVKLTKEILAADIPVKIILSIREEYLGYLYDFEKEVPQLLRKKLRIEPMTREKLSDFLKGINNYDLSLVKIQPNEFEKIGDEIFERLKDDNKKSRTIELPYLQVFFDKLYLNQTEDESHQKEAIISLKDLKKIGKIDDVLKDFLEEQVKEVSKELSSKKKVEPESLWTILSKFCTLEGTKEPISIKDLIERLKSDVEESLVKQSVGAFEKRRILNRTDNEEVYELSHDSLALRIKDNRTEDEISILQAKRIIKSKAVLKELFTENQIHNIIDPYFVKLESQLTDEEKQLIEDSKQELKRIKKEQEREERRKRLKKRRLVYAVIGSFILVLLILGFIGQSKLIRLNISSDIDGVNQIVTSANSNYLRVGDLENTDPTLALQLNKQALSLLDSANSRKDSLVNIEYGFIVPRLFIKDYKKKEYQKLKVSIVENDSAIINQGISIANKDYALYKIIKDKKPEDVFLDKRFINGIFPDRKGDSFNVWQASQILKDKLENDSSLVQVVFPSETNRAMVLYNNGRAGFWDMNGAYRSIGSSNYHISNIAPIRYSKIGYKILAALNDNSIVEWNLNSTIRKSVLEREDSSKHVIYHKDIELKDSVVSIAISSHRAKIFTVSDKGMGIIWAADTSRVELRDTAKVVFALNQDTVLCSAFSNNDSLIITGAADNTVKIWNSRDGNLVKTLKGHTGPVTSVAFSGNDRVVFTGSLDGTFRQWILPPMDSILNNDQLQWNKILDFKGLFTENVIETLSSLNRN